MIALIHQYIYKDRLSERTLTYTSLAPSPYLIPAQFNEGNLIPRRETLIHQNRSTLQKGSRKGQTLLRSQIIYGSLMCISRNPRFTQSSYGAIRR